MNLWEAYRTANRRRAALTVRLAPGQEAEQLGLLAQVEDGEQLTIRPRRTDYGASGGKLNGLVVVDAGQPPRTFHVRPELAKGITVER